MTRCHAEERIESLLSGLELDPKFWAKAAAPSDGAALAYADVLFACRTRAMRPQNANYREDNRPIWPLLDACGQPRERA